VTRSIAKNNNRLLRILSCLPDLKSFIEASALFLIVRATVRTARFIAHPHNGWGRPEHHGHFMHCGKHHERSFLISTSGSTLHFWRPRRLVRANRINDLIGEVNLWQRRRGNSLNRRVQKNQPVIGYGRPFFFEVARVRCPRMGQMPCAAADFPGVWIYRCIWSECDPNLINSIRAPKTRTMTSSQNNISSDQGA